MNGLTCIPDWWLLVWLQCLFHKDCPCICRPLRTGVPVCPFPSAQRTRQSGNPDHLSLPHEAYVLCLQHTHEQVVMHTQTGSNMQNRQQQHTHKQVVTQYTKWLEIRKLVIGCVRPISGFGWKTIVRRNDNVQLDFWKTNFDDNTSF